MAPNDQANLTGLLYFSDLTTFSKSYCYGNSPKFPGLKKHLLLSNIFHGKRKKDTFSDIPGIKQPIYVTIKYALMRSDIAMI